MRQTMKCGNLELISNWPSIELEFIAFCLRFWPTVNSAGMDATDDVWKRSLKIICTSLAVFELRSSAPWKYYVIELKLLGAHEIVARSTK